MKTMTNDMYLLDALEAGDTIYTVHRHRSASGMTHAISLFVIVDGKPLNLDYAVSNKWPKDFKTDQRHGGVKRTGMGMDMGFDLVYSLARHLFPKGHGCVGEKCPSNDHSNGDRDYTPHREGAEHWHNDGGYALLHRWI